MSFKILPSYLTETVKGIAATMNVAAAPILADALQDEGCEDWPLLRRLRDVDYTEYKRDVFSQLSRATVESLEAEVEAGRISKFRSSYFVRCRLMGAADRPINQLRRSITRKRPRGSGSRLQLAKRLQERLNERANRNWERSLKGQRRPTDRQILELFQEIEIQLNRIQLRQRERLLNAGDVLRSAWRASKSGMDSTDGGRITSGSYHYPWATTTVSSYRVVGGHLLVQIVRSGHAQFYIPGRWPEAMLQPGVLP